MPTDRTPQEWAEFCAKKVMGWEFRDGGGYLEPVWILPGGEARYGFSPYDNPDDALKVLERLSKIAKPKAPWTRRWRIDKSDEGYTVALLDVLPIQQVVFSTGPHFGPAVCLLAEKVIEANHA